MSKVIRSTTFALSFGYIAFGIVALVLFAAPLWYAWQVTMEDGRSDILHADTQRLTDVFHREGATGLKTFIDARVGMQLPAERILLLADGSLHRIAGNLHAMACDSAGATRHVYRDPGSQRQHRRNRSSCAPHFRAVTIFSWGAMLQSSRP